MTDGTTIRLNYAGTYLIVWTCSCYGMISQANLTGLNKNLATEIKAIVDGVNAAAIVLNADLTLIDAAFNTIINAINNLNAAVIPPIAPIPGIAATTPVVPLVVADLVPYTSEWNLLLSFNGHKISVQESSYGAGDTAETNNGFSGDAVIVTIIENKPANLPGVLTLDIQPQGATPTEFLINDSEFNIIRIDEDTV